MTNHSSQSESLEPITPFDEGWPDGYDIDPGDNGHPTSDEAAVNSWQHPCTLAQAFESRPPIQFVIEELFSVPSLSIVYGLPGEFKSMLLMDAALAVASGQDWLPSEERGARLPRKTMQVPVFWYDFDNGKRRCDERFEALARARGISEDVHVPFYYLSIPKPPLDASSPEILTNYLSPLIKQKDIQFVCIDNLATISGDADENSVEMANVMSHLRTLVERLNIACVVIHHMRKGSSSTADTHPGESLRGHSSINAAVDLALQVRRTETRITIKSTKSRGADVEPFAAEFRYTSPKDGELETASFVGVRVTGRGKGGDDGIKAAIMELIEAAGPQNQTEIVETAKEQDWAGKTKINNILNKLVSEKRLKMVKGGKNANIYSIP